MLEESSEFSGYWWLPGASEDRIQGTLELLEEGNCRFRGVGRFPTLVGEKVPVILGTSTSGERLTLIDSHLTQSPFSFSKQIGIYEAVPRRVLIGAHFESIEAVRFRAVIFEMPGFLRWFAPKLSLDPEEVEGDHRVIVSLDGEHPGTVRLPCRGAEASFLVRGPFTARWSLLGNEEVVIKQSAGIQLEFPEEQSEAAFFERIADFQVFFSFWWGKPTFFQNLWAKGEAGKREMLDGSVMDTWIRVVDRTAVSAKKADTGGYAVGAFIAYEDFSAPFLETWAAWQVVAERFSSVLELYAATLYGENNQYLVNQFLALAQALEIFHRIKYEGTYIDPSLFEKEVLPDLLQVLGGSRHTEFAKIASNKVRSLNNLDLRSRIEDLIKRHRSVVWLRLGRDTFAAELTNTRNYLTHRSERLRAKAKEGTDLAYLTFRCRFLLEILILAELGFSEKELETCVCAHITRGRWIGLHRHMWRGL